MDCPLICNIEWKGKVCEGMKSITSIKEYDLSEWDVCGLLDTSIWEESLPVTAG